MMERSRQILEKFESTSTSGIHQPELLSILGEVRAYWQDTFRPALASFSCEAVGGKPDAVDDVILMITLMGAGLGIHDDIIDCSINKHFRATILGLHGIDDALLVGDLFIVKALIMVREIVKKSLSPELIEKVIDLFENFFLEVWEGEFLETRCRRNLETELELCKKILWMSTADTEACTKLGAILGKGTEVEVETLSEVGRRLGYLFRLADEVKDTLNLEGNLQSRLENESVPLPILHSAQSSPKAKLVINKILTKPRISSSAFTTVMQFCLETDSFNYVLNLAKVNEAEALCRIESLKKSEATNALVLLVRNAFDRVAYLCLDV